MSYEHIITEYVDRAPARRHLVRTTERSVSARAWNEEVRSVNAFRQRTYKFFEPGKPEPALYFGVQFKEDFDREDAILKYAEVPVLEHDTIFLFYEAVGYDYKRKKFT